MGFETNIFVELIGNLGAMGFIFWLVHRTTTHTIPRLAENFEQASKEQREDFRKILESQREDFKMQIDTQRAACMEMVRQARDQFGDEMKREREFHKEQLERYIGALREAENG